MKKSDLVLGLYIMAAIIFLIVPIHIASGNALEGMCKILIPLF